MEQEKASSLRKKWYELDGNSGGNLSNSYVYASIPVKLAVGAPEHQNT